MYDFTKMDLEEMRTLQAQLNRAIEEKATERQRIAWQKLKEMYQNYVADFGPIILTLKDYDGCDYEEELDLTLIFSDPSRLDNSKY